MSNLKTNKTMEGNLSTADFLALENRRYCDYGHHGKGMAATGIGLAAGLGGGALLLAIAGIWGVNKASEARNQGAMALSAANAAALGALNNSINVNRTAIDNALANERISREGWQNANTPGIQSYIDVQATPTQSTQTTASAAAEAAALAQLYSGNGLSSAVQSSNYLRVQPISVKDCGCGCQG